MGAAVVGTDTSGEFVSAEGTLRLNHGSFPMNPFRFDRVQPRTFAGQQAQHDPYTCLAGFDPSIVLTQPGAYQSANVPRRVVPNQHQRSFTSSIQLLTTPLQKGDTDRTDRTTLHKTQQHLVGGLVLLTATHPREQSVAGQRFLLSIITGLVLFNQMGRLLLALPSVEIWLGKATPPDFISKAQNPFWPLLTQPYQPVASVFFRV